MNEFASVHAASNIASERRRKHFNGVTNRALGPLLSRETVRRARDMTGTTPYIAPMKKSPFPGMDPYLEQYWGDVHHRFIQYTCDALQPKLPDTLRARVEERVYLDTSGANRPAFVPDAHISASKTFEPPKSWSAQPETEDGGLAVANPLVIEAIEHEITEGFIEICERGGGKVVTVIEFLSPTNKLPGPGRELYRRKRELLRKSPTSLVEIDLVRRGTRELTGNYYLYPEVEAATYAATMYPGWMYGNYEFYPLPLRERLSRLPIPLREDEARVTLDLQEIVDQAYVAGRYDDTDYSKPAEPPLAEADAAWVTTLSQAD